MSTRVAINGFGRIGRCILRAALERMADEGYVTRADADKAKDEPVLVAGDPVNDTSVAPYFLEEVRKYLEAKYGAKALYESGLTVRTALDVKLQQAANQAVDRGLRRVDKHRGFRKPRRNVIAEGHTVDAFKSDRWQRRIAAGDIVPAVVRAVSDTTATLRLRAVRADAEASAAIGDLPGAIDRVLGAQKRFRQPDAASIIELSVMDSRLRAWQRQWREDVREDGGR